MDLTLASVEAAIGPLDGYAHQCHAASLALVQSGLLGPDARVARGSCLGVGGQHSWAVAGPDCYDLDATIVDVTLWSYDPTAPRLLVTDLRADRHHPHGQGHIMAWGCPEAGGGEEVTLNWPTPPSSVAREWLDMFRGAAGPLDAPFWGRLASHAPVEGWPAGEFYAAMDNTPRLGPLVPIDRLGMNTDLNPDGLYR